MLKRLFCRHKNKTCVTNIHGDLRNDMDCCSVWECQRCGKIFLKDELEPSCYIVNFKLPHFIEKIIEEQEMKEKERQLTHQHEDKGE